MIWNREPALVVGAVNALVALAVGFGLDISPEQVALVNAAVAAVLAFVTRQNVTPATKPLGQRGAVTVAEVCLVVIAIVFVLWAFGEVPR